MGRDQTTGLHANSGALIDVSHDDFFQHKRSSND
ncbi:hypothetical protein GGE16_001145 [Rhizobium leguminosarum]|uniref:Uncharacterized protein n=1 Tax=Rhizobium leguminosarum TaxID=384 RepID=A0AAE2MH80_RHILE|nr:hypothetical protein [Rhizobium leguminosarum]MBB4433094.1 hypothetical protein [Rhizobium esperanzae]MBB4294778.1 hypothetical protein [Rhizobium leguminosarum]MBB4306171.1 hypothetical protein [Rhizobium leguminosarum]MBB4418249.1 hypothetical protein [Rhizobium leguminosarum]